jgi:hypothetical protein
MVKPRSPTPIVFLAVFAVVVSAVFVIVVMNRLSTGSDLRGQACTDAEPCDDNADCVCSGICTNPGPAGSCGGGASSSAASSAGGSASSATPPSAPDTPDLKIESDRGYSATDDLTDLQLVNITVSGCTSGNSLTAYSGSDILGTGTCAANGSGVLATNLQVGNTVLKGLP